MSGPPGPVDIWSQPAFFFLMRLILLLACVLVCPVFGSSKEPLSVGATAPGLSVTLDDGSEVDLAEVFREGPVLLFFYPKADTPGCTKQACNLRDHRESVEKAGITVFGVSRDTVEKQAAFRKKYGLPYRLVADPDGRLGEAFGVGGYLGMVYKRQSFLVVDGKIAWTDLKARPGTQAQDAILAFESVSGNTD